MRRVWVYPFLILFGLQGRALVTVDEYRDQNRKLLLQTGKTGWDFFSPEDQTSQTTTKDKGLQFVARSPYVVEGGLQPTLTLRLDYGYWLSARAYSERWLKDYPKFGYDLQMSRDVAYGDLKGFEMELSASRSKRIIRQLVVKSKQEFWVFTCTSDQKHFSATWSACEKILKSARVNPI